jgi:hypothetical protein
MNRGLNCCKNILFANSSGIIPSTSGIQAVVNGEEISVMVDNDYRQNDGDQ